MAGSGVQVPFGDIPSDVHTAVLFPVGTNPVLHLKSMLAPLSVLGTAIMEPLLGATGIPQLTGRREYNENLINNTFTPVFCLLTSMFL